MNMSYTNSFQREGRVISPGKKFPKNSLSGKKTTGFYKLMLLSIKNFSKELSTDPSLPNQCYHHHILHRGDETLLNFHLTLATDNVNRTDKPAT